ncbi:amidase [Mesorhizobium japonicum]|uniref:Glu-tRNA amidotransferase, subunit A n=1 Tax=Mesorhizobium japonicum (strain LMG 29417 / CECT 9101 / MAFF 303099) TaxID=266835 RepID=Q98AB0_RHILO|nr:amidase [Mesorhizobium japonicum]BAB52426.1 Glu-tRNA amidotransferase, subunit A [Mesorhizobium japonicum MAFF 303099]
MKSRSSVPTSLEGLTACECLKLYQRRQLSPVEVVDDCLSRIDANNPMLNAFCLVDHQRARSAARASEGRWMKGEPAGVLDGVPVTIKDLTLTRDWPTRRGSLSSSAEGPWTDDAPVTARIREAGAVILGKTTTPEFGWKGVTDSPLYGITRNPWNPELTPGGSSGGAAVAAALNLGFLHQGSDGGGSIRIPASFTGTFGFKPTFGIVPQWPASAMTTLSHLGPMTRTAADAILMMNVIARKDARDGYAGPPYPGLEVNPAKTLKGLRIGYSRDLGYVKVAHDIERVTDIAVDQLRALEAEVVEVNPGFANPVKIFETFWFAGAARILSRMNKKQRQLLDPGFLEGAERGLTITLTEFQEAEAMRFELSALMAKFHEDYDFLVTPTMPIAPFPVGRNEPDDSFTGWVDWTPFTYPFNLTQQPAASLPSGLDDQGLPVGLQLVGARYSDTTVLAAAYAIESRLGHLSMARANIPQPSPER